MVKTSPSNAEGAGSVPGQRAKILYASWPKTQNINNRSNIITSLINTLKMVHIQKKKSLKKQKENVHKNNQKE